MILAGVCCVVHLLVKRVPVSSLLLVWLQDPWIRAALLVSYLPKPYVMYPLKDQGNYHSLFYIKLLFDIILLYSCTSTLLVVVTSPRPARETCVTRPVGKLLFDN